MFTIFKNVTWFFKREKYGYAILLLALCLISFLSIIPPTIVGIVIDNIAENSMTPRNLIYLGSALLMVPLTIYILNYIFHKTMIAKGHELSRQLRLLYLGKMFSTDSKMFEEYNKGELISRLSNDMPFITMAATNILTDTVYCFTLITFVIITMITSISLKLTIVAFTIVPVIFIILTLWRNHMRKYYKIHRKIFSKFFDDTLETIEGQRVIRAYTQEDNDNKKMRDSIDADINSWITIIKFEAMFGPMFDLTIAISTFLTFAYGSHLVITSQISTGDLIAFTSYITMVAGPIVMLGNVYNLLNQASIGSERFFEILNKETEVVDSSVSKDVLKFDKIEFDNVSFKYPFDERNVIDNITFTIEKGQTIGIVGKSGSGKSTIIRQLLREFNITDGQVLIDGEDISEYKIDSVRQLVGYVPQVHTLFRGSVEENLVIGNTQADESVKNSAIDIAAFRKDLQYMNDGLNTYIGESGSGLSGGQKQRLSIARAVIKNPEILILDDSLSAVDANTEKEIIGNIKEYRKGKTNLIISHRFSVIKNADKILVLSEGKISERGTHEELLQNKGWYYTHYMEQVRGSSND